MQRHTQTRSRKPRHTSAQLKPDSRTTPPRTPKMQERTESGWDAPHKNTPHYKANTTCSPLPPTPKNEHLAARLLQTHHLHTGRVTGTQAPKSTLGRGYDFQSLLTLFSPLSKEKAAIMPDDPNQIDILIGTDCISEGQNLQDCDYLINYDIHWNPVRIIQRFGRIDRIGSRNASIQLVNYWPDITLDEYMTTTPPFLSM